MRVDEFDYELPPERIAQRPLAERGTSRLLVLDREANSVRHGRFGDLPRWLRPGDLLVRNDTAVFPARLRARRSTGGPVEILLLRREGDVGARETWRCLARPAGRLRPGERISFAPELRGRWLGRVDGIGRIELEATGVASDLIERVGSVPLPPYIRRPSDERDRDAYQTVYARRSGAVAAPTAGLHFTEDLLRVLAQEGMEVRDLTLHVGPGTFQPVRAENVGDHRMDAETADVPPATVRAIERARAEGRRIVAVGTTTVRALEGSVDDGGVLRSGRRNVSLFIVPGFHFRIVDAMITNFHLPRSTLLMLVAAFAGRERVLEAYGEAIARGYRFYSYGDAMLIL